MKDKIKLDIISDVVCPWCIVGYKRLEAAITEMGIEDQVEIEWQPFELNPHMPVEGENVQEHIENKYGASREDQKRSQEQMAAAGEALGFKFDYFDDMKIVNTRDAHVLIDFAKEKGKQTALKLRLITAFFSERKDVSDRKVLLKEVEAIGLDSKEALARLENKEAKKEIQTKEAYWQSLGVNSVPTVVFNTKSALTGAQPIEVYKQVLTELLQESES
ncbi:DsbA family oxidoreductase [Joostella atrarenae]|uniref:DsbA family oxidoreductase n=1 Tax=Joostella atrarenae TaxID=679257 RepID=A0ABS9J4I6_9FLAO|nr:DsbA family oxidoreductase [Joostella atrarenae]MCF8715344.1 DsbA family oxidoreductase [Joostella atrarenae]